MTLTEIRSRSWELARRVLDVADARMWLNMCWCVRGGNDPDASEPTLQRAQIGYYEAYKAIQHLQDDPNNEKLRFWAIHYLAIFTKVTALPVETGGFGVEAVLNFAGDI